MDIHIYRETLYISAWKPLLTGFNHFSFTRCPLRWKLKEILITVYIGCNDSSQLKSAMTLNGFESVSRLLTVTQLETVDTIISS